MYSKSKLTASKLFLFKANDSGVFPLWSRKYFKGYYNDSLIISKSSSKAKTDKRVKPYG